MKPVYAILCVSGLVLFGCGKKEPTESSGGGGGPGRVANTTPKDRVSAPANTASLTYKDLLGKMRAKGLKVNMAPFGGTQLYTTRDQNGANTYAIVYGEFHPPPIEPPDLWCSKCQSEQAAREVAERTESGNFAWGVFVFQGCKSDTRFADAVRAALSEP